MQEDLESAEKALSRSDIETLVAVWKRSTTYKEGLIVREFITKNIPTLVDKYKIPYEGKSFREFIARYDAEMLDRECAAFAVKAGGRHYCLDYFIRQKNLRGVRHQIKKGFVPSDESIKAAIQTDQFQLFMEYLWPEIFEQKQESWLGITGLLGISVAKGNLQFTKFFADLSIQLSQKSNGLPYLDLGSGVMFSAVNGGRLEILAFLLEKLKEVRDEILGRKNVSLKVKELYEKQYEGHLDKALMQAALLKSDKVIDFIAKHYRTPDDALFNSAYNGDEELVGIFLDIGADPVQGLEGATAGGHGEIINYILTRTK